MPAPWSVVVPVKRLEAAKTRLVGPSPAEREALALAFAADVVAAALAVPAVGEVLVVTGDPVAGPALAALGARTVADPGGGLDAALRAGAAAAAPGPVAALTADLPAARTADLAAVLAAARARACVLDAEATGTTLLAAPDGALRPSFGPGSAARHVGGGAAPLPAADGLRRDVDTAADLAAAVRLGTGPRTAAAVAALAAHALATPERCGRG
ncbi:2-phospho-L-lactate guanylyltransferase [Vallicoccus soli]|uniref:Phosphoenolpyruvate guanylyltransferase n=1 Tax=Vallicoccus soli TaxID=2339232 RepID=A0A3A3Z2E1_9ACTN|nr:2-phospho-L-lactate guanylyltransferase [Vallicoccus soli]